MAQPRMNEVFKLQKRKTDFNASKRRKLQQPGEVDLASQLFPEPKQTSRKSVRISSKQSQELESQNLNVQISKEIAPVKTKTKTRGSTTKTRASTRSNVSAKTVIDSDNNPKNDIRAAFQKIDSLEKNEISEENESTETESTTSNDTSTEEVTSACDDHQGSPPSTPTKRMAKEENVVKQKRSRKQKNLKKDLLEDFSKTPEPTGYDFEPYMKEKSTSVRKRLVMRKRNSDEESDKTTVSGGKEELSQTSKSKPKQAVQKKQSADVVKHTSNVKSTKELNNELHAEKIQQKDVESDTSSCVQNKEFVTPKESCETVQSTKGEVEVSKCETKTKKGTDPAAMKEKLSKVANLSELKARLAKLDKAKSQVQEIRKQKDKQPKPPSEKLPAYERFHHLAIPLPPTLCLPFKYRMVAEVFQNVETIVSMMHKRQETCTFSKLKSAVQLLSRKTFEEKNLGQIKQVYPTAYTFRQEKGLMMMGNKAPGYQLTIDANLKDDLKGYKPSSDTATLQTLDSDGKPSFPASRLLHRKSIFNRNLISIVKQYHKEFLGNLEHPVEIPDEKLTRWHPKFRVDEVPDIKAADIPQPPDVKKLSTAREVLQHTTSMNPRMRKAFEIVAQEKDANMSNTATKTSNNKNPPTKSPAPALPSNAELRGVSQSLLDRIRAKEANKAAAAMIRSPAEDKRLERIGRLPEIVRIVRTFYVTQKKPALLLDDIIDKVVDSYRSSMGQAEAEMHVKLMLELCPDWVSTVQIRSGTYLKMDKNRDITYVQNKLNKLLKDGK